MIHNPHLNYRPDIDGLRALAIMLVIIFHAFPKFLRGGFIGVDIFFVISGYLITSIILKGLEGNNFSLLEFYSRRIKRIFPALIVVFAFSLIAGWFILLEDEYKLLGKHVAAGGIYISNFILQSESGYFDTAAQLKPFLHLWSLAIEEQFYLIFPILLIVCFRIYLNPALIISLALIFSFLLNITQIDNNLSEVFFFPHTRIWELLIGSSVAHINLNSRYKFDCIIQSILFHGDINKEKALANFFSWFGLLLIIIAWFSFNHKEMLFPGWWALMPAIGTACLILAGKDAWFNYHFLSNKIVVFVGLISYPLYLWHWPLLSFTRLVEMDPPSSKLRFLVLVISVLLAWLTYHFVENKIRYREQSLIPLGLLFCLLLISAVGYQIKTQQGYPERFQYSNPFTDEIGSDYWETQGWINTQSCLNRFGDYQFCLVQDSNRPITALLIGDSHANHLYPGLLPLTSVTGGNLINLGMGNCLAFLSRKDILAYNKGKHCQLLINKAFETAISTPTIKTVILAGAWAAYLKTKNKGFFQQAKDKHFKSHSIANNIVDFQDSFRNTLKTLVKAQKEIIFVMDVPWLGFEPSNCTERPWRITDTVVKTPCATLRANIFSNRLEYTQPVSQVLAEFSQVKIWNPINTFCDKSYCWAVKNGEMLYRDENHLSVTGSVYLGSHFHLQ